MRLQLVLILGIGVLGGHAQSFQLSPTRSISLKTCGWVPEHQVIGSTGYVPLSLAFDHQGRLWTGYTSKVFKLVPRAKPESGQQYNIVELSGSPMTCAVRLSRPTTESSPVAILFSNQDSMLAVANDRLHLIDRTGFKDQVTFDLLRPSDHQYYSVRQSPGRKGLVVVVDGYVQAESNYTWLDPDTLKIIHLCTYPPAPDYHHYIGFRSFADDGRFAELDNDNTCMFTNCIGTMAGKGRFWIAEGRYCSEKTTQSPELMEPSDRRLQPIDAILLTSQTAFLSNNRLVDNARSIVVYDQDGSLAHVVSAEKHEVKEDDWGTVSEDGSRVAVIIDEMAGGMSSLDISDHVASRRVDIFDSKTWNRTAQIELPLKGRIALAFTPDGKTLAIRTADLVQFFDHIP
jgi:hypothetical protein